jgi:hypothetical protein
MSRKLRPCLEMLQEKVLLSGASATATGLVSSVTAVVTRTLSGAQVAETFTETNVSDHDINVDLGATDSGFTVSQDGKTVWNPYEGVLPFSIAVETLKPGQSQTVHNTWDARANEVVPNEPWAEGSPVSGTFTISNSLDQGKATATVTIPKAWTVPLTMSHVRSPKPGPHVHEMTVVPLD